MILITKRFYTILNHIKWIEMFKNLRSLIHFSLAVPKLCP